ncbi:MAG: GAF domain-containing protein [Chloroflexaceae bacterium]|nr:GAF domain-containing protein [Chloroflexaceae bacterium]
MDDTTVTSSRTGNWELLGHIAFCGQDHTATHNTATLLEHLIGILQRHLTFPGGLLVAVRNGRVTASAGWGELGNASEIGQPAPREDNHSAPVLRLPLRAGAETVGYLVLSQQDASSEEALASPIPWLQAVAAQLGLLLSIQRDRDEEAPAWLEAPGAAPPTLPLHQPACSSNQATDGETDPSLKLLRRIALTVAAPHDVSLVYPVILEAMAEVAEADQTRLVIYHRAAGQEPAATEYGYESGTGAGTISGTATSPRRQPFPLTDNPLVAWLDMHQQPLVALHARQEEVLARLHEDLQQAAIRSVIFFPLVTRGQVSGCIEVDFRAPLAHPLTPHQSDLCYIIASQTAQVVDTMLLSTQARFNAQALQVKVGELSTLLEAARLLGSLLRPDEVLNNLMDLVSRQLGVSTVALWTITKEQVLVPAAMDGTPLEMAREMCVPVGKGLTGTVAATGAPLMVRNVEQDGGSLYPDFNRLNHLVSFMGVPVFYREKIIGVLSVMTTEQRDFTTDEMMLLIGLAGQAAIALENARLFQDRERRINELTSINTISLAVNATLDLDELLLALHRGISEVIDTTHSFIGLYDVGKTGESPTLAQRVVRDNDAVHLSDRTIPIDGSGLVDAVLLGFRPLLLKTPDEITDFWVSGKGILQHHPPTQAVAPRFTCPLSIKPASWLGVPIMHGDTVLGIINVQSPVAYAYHEDDQRFLVTVASQVAIAISNARLFNERERRLREITVLKDIGSAISSTLDLQGVLERLYHELGQAIDMSTSIIGVYDEQTHTLSYPVCYDKGRRMYVDPSPIADNASGWTIRNRQPLLIHTAEQRRKMGIQDFGLSVFDLRSGQSRIRHPQSTPVQSLLVTPIISGDTVLGVISIKSYQPYAFDEDDLRFLMTVASQIAITISNVRLFVEREKRIQELETFNEIGQALSSTVSFDELPTLIYRQTSRLIDTTNFYMALFDEVTREITFPLFYDHGVICPMEQVRAYESGRVGHMRGPVNRGLYVLTVYLTRRVIYRHEPLLLSEADLEVGEWMIELREELGLVPSNFARPRSWLGVPMIAADKVVGVIGIQHYDQPHAYGTSEVRLLSTIASWAAIALENARLFEKIRDIAASLEQSVTERTREIQQANAQLRQEKDHLETVHAITLELTSTLDLEQIISRALEIASTNLNVSRGSIMLRELKTGTLKCRSVLQEQGTVESVDLPISFEKGEGLVGWVMQHKETVYIADVRSDYRWVMETGRAEDVRSAVATPLMTNEAIPLGVLILTSPQVNHFTESQIRLLATIANEVAIALNNAQLYTYINEMATRLSDLLEQQKEETSRSRAILQSLTEGVIVLDEDQRIELVNWAAEHVLNIPASEILSRPLPELPNYGETEEQHRRATVLYNRLDEGLHHVWEHENIHRMSIELPHPSQMVALNLAPVVGQDGRSYGNVAVLRDVTREIQADQAKREFVSKVSHELRTPLTSIKGYIDLLLLGSMGDLNESQISFLNVVKTNANRLMDLINDILDMSRIEAGKINLNITQLDIRDIIHDAVQSLRLEAEAKNMSIVLELPDDLPVVEADTRRITQVIFNLFSNAVKYTYRNGRISVRAFLNPAQMLQVEVEDTGVGMSPDQLDKLFRPFYRADSPLREEVGGTGLGLSIAKSLVEQHGGEMWVESDLGKGSVFSFIIPLKQPAITEADEDTE